MKLFILILNLFILACDKDSFQQDPLKEQPKEIREGVSPELRKPEARPACPPDSLIIESVPSVGVFEEGEKGAMTFTGRVLKCGTEAYELEILNLPEGATYDSQTGVLEYTPPFSVVKGQEYFMQEQFKLRMKTIGEPVIIKEENIVYFVRRPSAHKPKIIGFEELPKSIEEGKNTQFYVLVKDEDFANGPDDISTPPRLNFVTVRNNESNALPYLHIYNAHNPQRDPNDKSLWRFTVNLRTQQFENVISRNLFVHFGVIAISSFGELSIPKEGSFEILNRVKEPYLSWPDVKNFQYKMYRGRKNILTFWAIDPLKEGYTQVVFNNSCKGLPGKAQCQCTYVGNSSSPSREEGSFCTIEWSIPEDLKGQSTSLSLTIRNTNFKDPKDVREISTFRTIFIEQAPPEAKPPDSPPPPPPSPVISPEEPPEVNPYPAPFRQQGVQQ